MFFRVLIEEREVNEMNLYGQTLENLEKYFESIGEKKFKATQVFEWIYQKREEKIENFSNIKKERMPTRGNGKSKKTARSGLLFFSYQITRIFFFRSRGTISME